MNGNLSLGEFLLILIVGGFIFYLVDVYLPLPDPVKLILRFVGILVLVFLILALFGIVPMPFKLW